MLLDDATLALLLREISAMEQTLEANNLPGPNENAMKRLRSLSKVLTHANGYFADKCTELLELAQAFYSNKESSAFPGGTPHHYAVMLDSVHRMHRHADRL